MIRLVNIESMLGFVTVSEEDWLVVVVPLAAVCAAISLLVKQSVAAWC